MSFLEKSYFITCMGFICSWGQNHKCQYIVPYCHSSMFQYYHHNVLYCVYFNTQLPCFFIIKSTPSRVEKFLCGETLFFILNHLSSVTQIRWTELFSQSGGGSDGLIEQDTLYVRILTTHPTTF